MGRLRHIPRISGHISTSKCTKAYQCDRFVVGRRDGDRGVRTLNSRRVWRMTMVHRLVLPERNASTSFCARRDEWGRIFGDWVPATRLGPGRLSISANRGVARIQRIR